jgi:hypothetical protein
MTPETLHLTPKAIMPGGRRTLDSDRFMDNLPQVALDFLPGTSPRPMTGAPQP